MMQEKMGDADFHERMQQAALLPEHDPVRAAVVQDVAIRGGEDCSAGREWLSLLEESQRIKLAMVSIAIPAGLEQRLLGIPLAEGSRAAVPWHKRPVGEVLTPRRLAVAAAVALIIAAGWWAVLAVSAYRQGRVVDRVASLAAGVHAAVLTSAPAEHIDTTDPKVAEAWLKPRLNFQAIMLGGGDAKLTGAAIVHLGTAPAALTRWERGGHRYSLLQFIPGAVGLPANFIKRTSVPDAGGISCKVDVWADPAFGCGWALVMDPSGKNTFIY